MSHIFQLDFSIIKKKILKLVKFFIDKSECIKYLLSRETTQFSKIYNFETDPLQFPHANNRFN